MRWRQRYSVLTLIFLLILGLLYFLEENIRLRHLLDSAQHLNHVGSLKKDFYLPPAFSYLKHLRGKYDRLRPAFQHPAKEFSQLRTNASLVIGVPTIKRDKQSYLMATITSIVDNLSPEDISRTLILISIGEPWEMKYVRSTTDRLNKLFKKHIDSGLIEILSPPKDFYPDLSRIKSDLKDTREHLMWRTKQNYDYSYLMLHSSFRGKYYLQLEDDVETKANYSQAIYTFINERSNPNWFMLEFSTLGFIGKLFHTRDLHALVNFFLMFSADMPIDWLLEHYQTSKFCSLHNDPKTCAGIKNQHRFRAYPSLFQHLGVYSSLHGKTQKLKVRDFGKEGKIGVAPRNPEVLEIESSLREYNMHTISSCYSGDGFFWAARPEKDDQIEFKYDPPISIKRVHFESGNAQHPQDKFYDTTVDVQPHTPPKPRFKIKTEPDGFITVTTFSHESGIAEALIDPALGPISSIRLKVHSKSNTRVLLNEIVIESVEQTNPQR